jgi:cbb3-type cytochrome oxidase maturation protein
MNIIFLLIPVSILIAAAFLAAFIWAVKTGQYEDTLTPSMRVLLNDGTEAARPAAAPSETVAAAKNHFSPESPYQP